MTSLASTLDSELRSPSYNLSDPDDTYLADEECGSDSDCGSQGLAGWSDNEEDVQETPPTAFTISGDPFDWPNSQPIRPTASRNSLHDASLAPLNTSISMNQSVTSHGMSKSQTDFEGMISTPPQLLEREKETSTPSRFSSVRPPFPRSDWVTELRRSARTDLPATPIESRDGTSMQMPTTPLNGWAWRLPSLPKKTGDTPVSGETESSITRASAEDEVGGFVSYLDRFIEKDKSLLPLSDGDSDNYRDARIPTAALLTPRKEQATSTEVMGSLLGPWSLGGRTGLGKSIGVKHVTEPDPGWLRAAWEQDQDPSGDSIDEGVADDDEVDQSWRGISR